MINFAASSRSVRAISLLALFAMLLLMFTPVAHAQKTFYWESFDVFVQIEDNGDLSVAETQTIVFSGGIFSFGYATIEKNNLDAITNISVREGDQIYSRSSSGAPYTFSVDDRRNETEIEWHFPAAQGRQTYVFEYTVEGAVKVDEGGYQLRWIAIPTDMLSRVQEATVTVAVPDGVTIGSASAWLDGVETSSAVQSISADNSQATFAAQSLVPGQPLEVGVRFPLDQIELPMPNWQRNEALQDTLGLVLIGVSILLVIGGPVLALLLWYTRGRDPEVGIVADLITEPPSDLPPAVVGTLIDERAEMQDIMSTMIDLARRGFLTIEELERDFNFERTTQPISDLRSYEKSFVKGIFGSKTSRKLNDLRYKFSSKLPGIREELYDELVDSGFAQTSPEKVRNRYRAFAFLFLGLGILLFFMMAGLAEVIPFAVCPVIALLPTIIALMFTSSHMPRKTEKGALEAAKWEAFKRYLKDMDAQRDLESAAAIFERYLPYAVAFGFERSWIRKFSSLENVPAPTWYGPMHRPVYRTGRYGGRPFMGGAGGAGTGAPGVPGGGVSMPTLEGMSGSMGTSLNNMSSGLTRMLNSSSTVMQSVKSTSSSSGSFGGGGGFSGGFSGGSSGGGGRGFG